MGRKSTKGPTKKKGVQKQPGCNRYKESKATQASLLAIYNGLPECSEYNPNQTK